jgi:RNA polymerase sigma-70 factor (ECF subfamily)
LADTGGGSEAERLKPAAVAALYACHADELRAYLLGLLRDGHLADEALQAAFAKATERGHTARGDSLKAWLFRVAHNEAIDLRRRLAAEGKSVRAAGWWKARVEPAPEQAAKRRETVERVRRAVEALPAEQREVVRLRMEDEKTFAEIAALTGKPLGTILTRMRLATKKLAEALRGVLEP